MPDLGNGWFPVILKIGMIIYPRLLPNSGLIWYGCIHGL